MGRERERSCANYSETVRDICKARACVCVCVCLCACVERERGGGRGLYNRQSERGVTVMRGRVSGEGEGSIQKAGLSQGYVH